MGSLDPGSSKAATFSQSAALQPTGRRLAWHTSRDPERRAALQVLQWGGSLEICTDEGRLSVSSPADVPAGPFQVAQIGLGDAPVGDAELKHLQGLSQLEELALWNTSVSDLGLEHLKGVTTLRNLYLSGTVVRGPGLGALTGLRR